MRELLVANCLQLREVIFTYAANRQLARPSGLSNRRDLTLGLNAFGVHHLGRIARYRLLPRSFSPLRVSSSQTEQRSMQPRTVGRSPN